MSYEKYDIDDTDYNGLKIAEIFALAFELGMIFTCINFKLRDEIIFSSTNKRNIIGYCNFKKIQYEIRDHDDFPTLVLK